MFTHILLPNAKSLYWRCRAAIPPDGRVGITLRYPNLSLSRPFPDWLLAITTVTVTALHLFHARLAASTGNCHMPFMRVAIVIPKGSGR